MNGSKDKILVVAGPTASGKSSLAVELALEFNGEIISADSVSVYKGLDIGSAKPTEEEKRGVPHYMIDVVSPKQSFSVGDYEEAALPIVRDILSRGKLPVLCGGTGFYINSVLYKMSYGLSKGNLVVREKYERMAKTFGNDAVFSVLEKCDPETARKLHPNDLVRVIRALEIYETSGIKKSDIKDEKEPRFEFLLICPSMPREVLYGRINRRVDDMIERGLESEVRGLLESGVTLSDQCMQGIGYKETAEAILSGVPVPTELIKMNTRRYAKRQITFFKRENPILIDGSGSGYCGNALKIADKFLNY